MFMPSGVVAASREESIIPVNTMVAGNQGTSVGFNSGQYGTFTPAEALGETVVNFLTNTTYLVLRVDGIVAEDAHWDTIEITGIFDGQVRTRTWDRIAQGFSYANVSGDSRWRAPPPAGWQFVIGETYQATFRP